MARTFYISVEKRGTVTNGDMIKAMFNPYKICKYEFNVHVYMTERAFEETDYQMNYDRRWWNAPYKAESEESE